MEIILMIIVYILALGTVSVLMGWLWALCGDSDEFVENGNKGFMVGLVLSLVITILVLVL